MRNISAAKSVASSPPVPARISRSTFFSSLGSLGISRTLSSDSTAASRASRWASSSCASFLRSSSESLSRIICRASAIPVLICLYSRNFSTIGVKSLWALACFWYFAVSAKISGSLIKCVIFSYLASSCSSFSNISNRHRLRHCSFFHEQRFVERPKSDFQLCVVRLLRRYALQPQARKSNPLQHHDLAQRRETNDLIGNTRDRRNEDDPGEQLHGEGLEGNKGINHRTDEHHHHQKAGAATRMKSRVFARVVDRQTLLCLVCEHHFVFCSVVFKNSANVTDLRYQNDVHDENDQPNESVCETKQERSPHQGEVVLQPAGQHQRQQLEQQNENCEGNDDIHCHHPSRHFLGSFRVPGVALASSSASQNLVR